MGYNKYEYELKEAKFLLKQIGFTNEDIINQIISHYKIEYRIIEKYYHLVSYGSKRNNYKPSYITTENVIDNSLKLLRWEVELRKKYHEFKIIQKKSTDYISATDLASFIFCTASYSISKSFKIEHFLNKSKIDEGNQQHEELRLINKKKFGFNEHYISKLDNKQKSVINKLKSCKLIYCGHDEDGKVFVNHEKKFIAKPDYIFLDPKNNYFIIEEKYHYQKNIFAEEQFYKDLNKNKNFYSNNIIQLQSYVDYLKEYDIKYGVLINWYYTIKNDKLFFSDFTYKIIKKGNNNQFLEKTFSDIHNFKKNGTIQFANNINIKKCLNCSVNLYCSHKTDNFDKLQIPYNINDLKLINIENNIDDEENNEVAIPIV
jgi:hypothetical protein